MVLKSYSPPTPPRDITDAAYVRKAREDFLRERPGNLSFLLEKRYGWMNEYADGKSAVVELGAGLGLSREFIRNPKLLLTDVTPYPWIDFRVDAMDLPFCDESLDVIICSHLLHHLGSPAAFLKGLRRALKPGGVVLIQELEASLLLRLLQRVMKNEGWSFHADVFDERASCVSAGAAGPWAANTAIPRLLFSSRAAFEGRVSGFELIRNELCEGLIFPLSGGVLAKVPTMPLPRSLLELTDRLDRLAIRAAPKVFALGRRVVLLKSAGVARGE